MFLAQLNVINPRFSNAPMCYIKQTKIKTKLFTILKVNKLVFFSIT